MSEVEGNVTVWGDGDHHHHHAVVVGDNDSQGSSQPQVTAGGDTSKIVVPPTLRVEMLRDDDGNSSTGSYISEEEGASHGETSDQDCRHSDTDAHFQPPDDDLRERIINQVEFYFSDVNILKDAFLLKHVRRNKLGYVSLKLITSFKKVKSLTRDFRIVAYSLQQSRHLEVNEEGTKVRRKATLPEYDETTPSRTVVAVNLPFENPSIENVAELFSKCGDIALVRVLRPGKSIPQDVKKHVNKHPEIGTTMCAVVEFEAHESAKKACEMMTNDGDWRKGMRVVLLAQRKKEKEPLKNKTLKKDSEGGKSEEERDDGSKILDSGRKRKQGKRKNSRVDELSKQGENICYSSGSEPESSETSPSSRMRANSAGQLSKKGALNPMTEPSPNRLSPKTTPKTSPRSSPRSSPRGSPTARRKSHGRSPLASELSPSQSPRPSPGASPELRRRTNSSGNIAAGESGSSPSSPWVQRRLKAQQDRSPLAGNSPSHSPLMGRRLADGSLAPGAPPPRMANMVGVVRQPRGPDGTRGFTSARQVNSHDSETNRQPQTSE